MGILSLAGVTTRGDAPVTRPAKLNMVNLAIKLYSIRLMGSTVPEIIRLFIQVMKKTSSAFADQIPTPMIAVRGKVTVSMWKMQSHIW